MAAEIMLYYQRINRNLWNINQRYTNLSEIFIVRVS